MSISLFLAATLAAATPGAEDLSPPVRPFESPAELTAERPIDRLVLARLEKLGIRPARLCSDEVFLRRVYLDVIGTLPSLDEARAFLADRDPGKRQKLIDELLAREEYADYWAMRWGDLLRVKSEFPINLWPNSVQAYHRWIRASLRENKPYDRFARELLTESGSNFRVPPVNFYRATADRQPEALARAVALVMMGVRTDGWPEARRAELAVFFSRVGYKATGEWKEEIVLFDALRSEPKLPEEAVLPDGTTVRLPPGKDPREVFAEWLLAPGNPWFARNMANRAWFWLLGRGIVHEPDDFRPDNPPGNPELLAHLERQLVSSGYDVKALFREILNSKTYQLSSIPRSDHAEAAAQFAYYPVRRLDAEVLIDALGQLTGTTEEYWSAIPEPFTIIPSHQRSIALADGSVTSSFLEMFGRPPRDTGLASERANQPTAAQRLHLLNSSHVRLKIERSGKLREMVGPGRRPLEAINRVYLAVLSRYPTPEELQTVREYASSGKIKGREALVDLVWALVNTSEFLYRH